MTIFDELAAGVITRTPEDTEALGRRLAEELPDDSALALHGDLGCGKTTLVRGLARGMGIHKAITSPTYNLLALYRGTRQLAHLDAYRLESSRDLESLGLEALLESPFLLAVEWPDKVPQLFAELPVRHLTLSIQEDGSHRIVLLNQQERRPFP